MTMKTMIVLAFCVSTAVAQTAPQKPAPAAKKVPTISVDTREKFFKAQAEFQNASFALREATQAAQIKNSVLQQQMDALKNACGKEYQPNMDKDGEIVCTETPKAAVPAPVVKK